MFSIIKDRSHPVVTDSFDDCDVGVPHRLWGDQIDFGIDCHGGGGKRRWDDPVDSSWIQILASICENGHLTGDRAKGNVIQTFIHRGLYCVRGPTGAYTDV